MKYSGLVPQNVTVIAVNASCKIILLIWNSGSGVYGHFSVSYFSFSFGAVITLVIARLPLGDSYQSGVCDFFSASPVGGVVTLEVVGVITLEYSARRPGVLACVVRWCTRGSVLIFPAPWAVLLSDELGCSPLVCHMFFC